MTSQHSVLVVEPPKDVSEAVAEPLPASVTRRQASLDRVVWRWHFYAGVIVAPVLFVVAIKRLSG